MTTRETTLGALTAADLGKRVRIPDEWGGPVVQRMNVLARLDHRMAVGGAPETFVGFAAGPRDFAAGLQTWGIRLPSTTPVTVYEKEEA